MPRALRFGRPFQRVVISAWNLTTQADDVALVAVDSHWMTGLARAGYAAKALVYLAIGWLAGLTVLGRGGAITDAYGVLAAVDDQPLGRLVLGLVAVGLAGYAMWRLTEAVLDPEQNGRHASGMFVRLGAAASGLSYMQVAGAAAWLAMGGVSEVQDLDSVMRDRTSGLLQLPLGAALVAAAGALLIMLALSQLQWSLTARFKDRLALSGVSSAQRRWILSLGRAGLAARGVVFGIMGVFLLRVALEDSPTRVVGIGGALLKLAHQPLGPVWLALVVVGLMCYGVFELSEARYRRLRGAAVRPFATER